LAGNGTISVSTAIKIKKLKIVLVLVSSYLIIEVLTGFFSGSLALLADAGHMFTDAFGIGLALFATTYSQRAATPGHTFGFYRTEILASLANGVILMSISVFIVYEAYRRIFEPTQIQSIPMFVVAVIGLIVNMAGMLYLRNVHTHNHGQSYSDNDEKDNHEEHEQEQEHKDGKKAEHSNMQDRIKNSIFRKTDKRKQDDQEEDLNMQGARLELLSDTVGSIGVIIAATIIFLTNFRLIDPIISIGLAIFMIPRTWSIIKKSMNILMEGTPSNLSYEEIQKAILQINGVTGIFELHIWSITSGMNALSAHVVIMDTESSNRILQDINALLEKRFKISHTTIQLEGYHSTKDLKT
jgi:cobalt-zinc-cadmium efflux system protein